jgi:outer membrane protein assembly factor BamB
MRHVTTMPAVLATSASRRAFLQRSVVLGAAFPVLGSVLAACGDDDDDADAPAADRDAEPTATAATEAPTGQPSAARTDATAAATAAPGGATTAAASPSAEFPAVGALRLADGAVVWSVSSPQEASRSVLGAGEDVVLIKESGPFDASGSGSQQTIAYDAADGSERWRRATSAVWTPPGPIAGQGIVVLADQDAGALVGVDVATGEERWRAEHRRVESPDAPVANSSTVAVVWNEDDSVGGPDDTSRLRGIDRLTGDELWVSDFLLFDQSGNVIERSPAAVLDEVLAVPTGTVGEGGVVGDATVTAIDMRTGATLWQAPPLDDPVAADGVVVGTRGSNGPAPSVTALDAASGQERWTAPGRASYGDLLAIGDGVLVVFAPDNPEVVAYELSSGTERWRVPLTLEIHPQRIDGTSLVLLWEGQLAVLSTTDGATLWSATEPFGSPLMNSVGSNGATVFVAINSRPWGD